MFAQIYLCPKCGEVWHTEIAEEIDTENDKVCSRRVCSHCYSDVTEALHEDQLVLHALTDDEIFWESYDPSENFDLR